MIGGRDSAWRRFHLTALSDGDTGSPDLNHVVGERPLRHLHSRYEQDYDVHRWLKKDASIPWNVTDISECEVSRGTAVSRYSRHRGMVMWAHLEARRVLGPYDERFRPNAEICELCAERSIS